MLHAQQAATLHKASLPEITFGFELSHNSITKLLLYFVRITLYDV